MTHDEYGKLLLTRATNGSAMLYGGTVAIDYGAGLPARVDGTVAGSIAVEFESRVSRQVRGAVLDLICHPYPKKLLALLPVHMSNPTITLDQCRNILHRFCSADCCRVVLLKGTGVNPQFDDDSRMLTMALRDLGANL